MRPRHGRFWRGWRYLPLDDAVLDKAAAIHPAKLRSLDALHLATALSIRDEIGLFVTYDERRVPPQPIVACLRLNRADHCVG